MVLRTRPGLLHICVLSLIMASPTLASMTALGQVIQNPFLTWSAVLTAILFQKAPQGHHPTPDCKRTPDLLHTPALPPPVTYSIPVDQITTPGSRVPPSGAGLGLGSHGGPALSLTPPTPPYPIHQPSPADFTSSLYAERVLSSPPAPWSLCPSSLRRWATTAPPCSPCSPSSHPPQRPQSFCHWDSAQNSPRTRTAA